MAAKTDTGLLRAATGAVQPRRTWGAQVTAVQRVLARNGYSKVPQKRKGYSEGGAATFVFIWVGALPSGDDLVLLTGPNTDGVVVSGGAVEILDEDEGDTMTVYQAGTGWDASNAKALDKKLKRAAERETQRAVVDRTAKKKPARRATPARKAAPARARKPAPKKKAPAYSEAETLAKASPQAGAQEEGTGLQRSGDPGQGQGHARRHLRLSYSPSVSGALLGLASELRPASSSASSFAFFVARRVARARALLRSAFRSSMRS
jgi:hypothetical protein